MIWTGQTPIYLPLVYPDSILTAAYRLADDVAQALGARPPLRPQPAPFGEPAILIAPDPAYTAAVAPDAPQTFAVLSYQQELTITGAEPFGTVLGLAWVAQRFLGLGPLAAWQGDPAAVRESVAVDVDHVQPRWPAADRPWHLSASTAAAWPDERLWLYGEALLRAGANRLVIERLEPRFGEVLAKLGVPVEVAPPGESGMPVYW